MHCLRSDGSERKWFETPEEAAAFRGENPNYFGDVIVLCGRCGFYHCSNPGWDVVRPWETPVEELRMN
jgi:hypothetical protein